MESDIFNEAWDVYYDQKQNKIFLAMIDPETKKYFALYIPKGTYVGERKANNLKKYNCIKIGSMNQSTKS